MRLDKAVAPTVLTRTEARRAIAAGRARVKGEVLRDAGAQVLPEDVTLDGEGIQAEEELYIMVNKPAGVVTATEDGHFQCVSDLLPDRLRRRGPGPVGRLDRDVTGLLLMTTDGQLSHRLTSPKWKAEKRYRARCEGRLTDGDVKAFSKGVALSDFTARPAEMTIIEADEEASLADVSLTEGKFHQVKRMFAAIGHPLISLQRLQIGTLTLDPRLKPGEWRVLSEDEIKALLKLCDLANGEGNE